MTETTLSQRLDFDLGDVRPDKRRGDWADLLDTYFYPLDCATPDSFVHGRLTARDVSDLRIGWIDSDPMQVTRTTRHVGRRPADFFFMPIPLEGARLWLEQRGRRAELSAERMAFVATADPYSYDQPASGRSHTLRIEGTALRDRLPDADDFAAISFPGDHRAMIGVFLSFARSFCEAADRLSAAEARQLARQLVDLLALVLDGADAGSSESSIAAAHRRRVIQHIERHFRDCDLTVAGVAAAVGLSERYLQKLFAGRDQTVSGLLRQRRIAEAQRLLEARRDTVSAVAYKVGFMDPAHFSRVFRRETGISPQGFARN